MLKDRRDAVGKHEMFLFAFEVHHQYVLNFKKGSSPYEHVRIAGNEMRKALSQDRCGYNLTQDERELFLKYLDAYFGLRMAKINDGMSVDSVPSFHYEFFVIKK